MSEAASVIDELEESFRDEEINRTPIHVAKPSTGEYYCGLGTYGRSFKPHERHGCHPTYIVGTTFCANCGRPWCKECKRIADLLHT